MTEITDWVWSGNETPVWNEETGRYELALPGASVNNPLTPQLLEEYLLPGTVNAALVGELEVAWDLTGLPDEFWAGEHTVSATVELPEGYALSQEAKPMEVTVVLGGAELYDVENLGGTIKTVSPDGISFHLFDYKIHENWTDADNSEPENITTAGINKDHALLFKQNNSENGKLNEWGGWNFWTGTRGPNVWSDDSYPVNPVKYEEFPGIVATKLGGDGYPQLALDNDWLATALDGRSREESLGYLFNGTPDNANKKSYPNVKGLLYIDENGNYTFDSRKHFATVMGEASVPSTQFTVYENPAIQATGGGTDNYTGQFFPFTSADVAENNPRSDASSINHYFGMSLSIDFAQPTGGKISNGAGDKPMVFEFAGDDDVWIFIDGVLVADLGGIHNEMGTTINFATGEIQTGLATVNGIKVSKTSDLRAKFEDAGGDKTDTYFADDSKTFKAGTNHTLKMFFLERGNGDSNLKLSFNLFQAEPNTLKNVDQDGTPITGAEFEIQGDTTNEKFPLTITDNDGTVELENTDGVLEPGLDDTYTLTQTTLPAGFRSLPMGEISLVHHEDSNTILVEDKNNTMWKTGVVSGFAATVTQTGGDLRYGKVQDNGTVSEGDKVSNPQSGLIVAVPLLDVSDDHSTWAALYGNGIDGYSAAGNFEMSNNAAANQAIAFAALKQMQKETYTSWYLKYNDTLQRFEGTLEDLPGDPSRYYFVNKNGGDIVLGYFYFDLNKLGVSGSTTTEKMKALVTKYEDSLKGDGLTQDEYEGLSQNFKLLYIQEFNRQFYTRLIVPSIRNAFMVEVVDAEGSSITKDGMEFKLYSDENCQTEVQTGDLTNVAGHSMIVFEGGTKDGKAALVEGKTYYLKQTAAADGYDVSNETVKIVVDKDGVHADAGTANDGISVRAGVGKLVEPMARYASDGDVNVTLRDITATKQTSASGGSLSWSSSTDTLNLTYGEGTSAGKGLEYGTTDNSVPFFTVDEGYVWAKVTQTLPVNRAAAANKEDLNGVDLTGLFTGSTNVVVTNETTQNYITFDPNGGNWNGNTDPKANLIQSGTVAMPIEPTRTNYVFKGWSSNKDTYTEWTNKNLTESATVYAHWDPTYTLTYNENTGTNTSNEKTNTGRYQSGATQPLSALPAGWNTNADKLAFVGWTEGTNVYTKTKPATVKPTDTVDKVTFGDANITVYAVWAKDENNNDKPDYSETKYTLTYDANGGTGGPEKQENILSGTTVTLSETKPAHDAVDGVNVVFIGWSAARDSKIYSKDDAVPSTIQSVKFDNQDITVYALWGYDTNGNSKPDVQEDKWTVTFGHSGYHNSVCS